MKLTIKDRILIEALYPMQADIVTQTLIRDISKKVVLSQEEIEQAEIRPRQEGGLQWNTEKASGMIADIFFTDAERECLKKQIERMDNEKKVTLELLDLCIKIKDGK